MQKTEFPWVGDDDCRDDDSGVDDGGGGVDEGGSKWLW